MFEITKPITTIGIGFDELPIEILNSNILTGNELGKLAGIESLPDETAVNDFKLIELSEIFLKFEDDKKTRIFFHKKRKNFYIRMIWKQHGKHYFRLIIKNRSWNLN